jgi:hypothetical protein
MSMPITCTPHKDWLFYILYCGDTNMLCDLIRQCVKNVAAHYHYDPDMLSILEHYQPRFSDSIHVLRSKFFVLLHEDEKTRIELVHRDTKLRGYFGPVPLQKANNFYVMLHTDLIPKWVSDESITLEQFIDSLRDAYLIS